MGTGGLIFWKYVLLSRVHCCTYVLGCVSGSSRAHKDVPFARMTAWDLQGGHTTGEGQVPGQRPPRCFPRVSQQTCCFSNIFGMSVTRA